MDLFKDIQNKVILITGGYGYLGCEMSKSLNKAGAKLYVLGRDESKFAEVFKEENRDNLFFMETDVSSSDSIKKSIEAIGEKESKIDVLINNAYFGKTNHPERMTSEEWRRGIEGGVNHFFDFIVESIRFLKKSKNGKIINISSMYGVVIPDLAIYEGREELLNPPNYGTAKAAVIHLTKYYAMYLGKYNINVNAISPGPFPSVNVQNDKNFVNRLVDKTKLKRIGDPKDLIGVVFLLSSEASSYITGQNIIVDGGWTI